MNWQEILRKSSPAETIKATALRKVPHLKDCPHWDRAIFLGCISYRVAFANYDGALVRYDNKVYYVSRSQIEALRPWVRWDMRKKVVVVQD